MSLIKFGRFIFRNLALKAKVLGSASNQFLRRYATNFSLISFVSFYLNEQGSSESQETGSLSSLVQSFQSSFGYVIQNEEKDQYSCKLSEYDIQRRLGKVQVNGGLNCYEGSNAAVYEASHNGKECAVKILFNFGASSHSEQILKEFHREFELLAANDHGNVKSMPQHPNIIKIFEKFVDQMPVLFDSMESYPQALPRCLFNEGYGRSQTLFLVMPKYSCSLREYLERNKHVLSFEQMMNLFQQLLEGVTHLERSNVAHRDLKTDNVLVDSSAECVFPKLAITDFGCCLNVGSMSMPYGNDYICKGGNISLMAPEILETTPGCNVFLDYSKADAWAVGAIAYEIFGHANPFYTVSPSEFRSGDELADAVVFHMLNRDPDERLSSEQASTVIFLLRNAPKDWLSPNEEILDMDVNRWLLEYSIITMRKCLQHKDLSSFPSDLLLSLVFVSRISVKKILDAIQLINSIKNDAM